MLHIFSVNFVLLMFVFRPTPDPLVCRVWSMGLMFDPCVVFVLAAEWDVPHVGNDGPSGVGPAVGPLGARRRSSNAGPMAAAASRSANGPRPHHIFEL